MCLGTPDSRSAETACGSDTEGEMELERTKMGLVLVVVDDVMFHRFPLTVPIVFPSDRIKKHSIFFRPRME
jgi:hypothetical protein